MEPFGGIWSYLEPFSAILSHIEALWAISSHFKFGAIWVYLESLQSEFLVRGKTNVGVNFGHYKKGTILYCFSVSVHFQSIGPLGQCFLLVYLSICVSVCSLLRYCLNVFLPPLPEVGCPILLEIWNPWEKVMERSGLRFEHFSLQVVLNCQKTWWKPHFPID